MLRLRDVSLRTKLYGLFIGYTLTVVFGVILAGVLMERYRVGGTVYTEVVDRKHLTDEMTPPPLLIGRVYLMLQEMQTATTDAQRDAAERRYRQYVDEYEKTRAEWLKKDIHPDARRALETTAHLPAQDVFKQADPAFFNLVRDAKTRNTDDTRAALARIKASYDEHSRAMREASEAMKTATKSTENDVAGSIRMWSNLTVGLSVVALAIFGLVGWAIVGSVVKSAGELNDRVRQMASGAGDLTARLAVDGKDEMGQLAEGINAVIGKIQGIVGKARESSLQLLSIAGQIALTARNQEQTVNNLSASTTQVAASVREVSATSKDLAGTMNEVSQTASHAAELATRGRDNTTKMATEMKQLVESTKNVSDRLSGIREKADSINAVVSTITKVADQTNLLSINAAIEAEKAGEYGRGFLVVAREIRRLADQTAVATLDIETMVRQMQDAVNAGVMQMDKFADEVRSGVGQVTKINQMTWEIINEVQSLSGRFQLVNEGMRNQTAGAQQINDAMGQIAEATRRSAQSIQEFERATATLRGSVEGLNSEIAQFKT
ncbi:MAG: methyl-accepting chemotaxis protein [Planctomycetes bacterium]|nr:methyl-accepting chemotaxis protein [Planctomycetota bacterium]